MENGDMSFSDEEKTCLRWARTLNARRVGFLGPTVRRQGPLPVYDRLVRQGYVRVVEGGRRDMDQFGYWLLPKGEHAIEEPPK